MQRERFVDMDKTITCTAYTCSKLKRRGGEWYSRNCSTVEGRVYMWNEMKNMQCYF